MTEARRWKSIANDAQSPGGIVMEELPGMKHVMDEFGPSQGDSDENIFKQVIPFEDSEQRSRKRVTVKPTQFLNSLPKIEGAWQFLVYSIEEAMDNHPQVQKIVEFNTELPALRAPMTTVQRITFTEREITMVFHRIAQGAFYDMEWMREDDANVIVQGSRRQIGYNFITRMKLEQIVTIYAAHSIEYLRQQSNSTDLMNRQNPRMADALFACLNRKHGLEELVNWVEMYMRQPNSSDAENMFTILVVAAGTVNNIVSSYPEYFYNVAEAGSQAEKAIKYGSAAVYQTVTNHRVFEEYLHITQNTEAINTVVHQVVVSHFYVKDQSMFLKNTYVPGSDSNFSNKELDIVYPDMEENTEGVITVREQIQNSPLFLHGEMGGPLDIDTLLDISSSHVEQNRVTGSITNVTSDGLALIDPCITKNADKELVPAYLALEMHDHYLSAEFVKAAFGKYNSKKMSHEFLTAKEREHAERFLALMASCSSKTPLGPQPSSVNDQRALSKHIIEAFNVAALYYHENVNVDGSESGNISTADYLNRVAAGSAMIPPIVPRHGSKLARSAAWKDIIAAGVDERSICTQLTPDSEYRPVSVRLHVNSASRSRPKFSEGDHVYYHLLGSSDLAGKTEFSKEKAEGEEEGEFGLFGTSGKYSSSKKSKKSKKFGKVNYVDATPMSGTGGKIRAGDIDNTEALNDAKAVFKRVATRSRQQYAGVHIEKIIESAKKGELDRPEVLKRHLEDIGTILGLDDDDVITENPRGLIARCVSEFSHPSVLEKISAINRRLTSVGGSDAETKIVLDIILTSVMENLAGELLNSLDRLPSIKDLASDKYDANDINKVSTAGIVLSPLAARAIQVIYLKSEPSSDAEFVRIVEKTAEAYAKDYTLRGDMIDYAIGRTFLTGAVTDTYKNYPKLTDEEFTAILVKTENQKRYLPLKDALLGFFEAAVNAANGVPQIRIDDKQLVSSILGELSLACWVEAIMRDGQTMTLDSPRIPKTSEIPEKMVTAMFTGILCFYFLAREQMVNAERGSLQFMVRELVKTVATIIGNELLLASNYNWNIIGMTTYAYKAPPPNVFTEDLFAQVTAIGNTKAFILRKHTNGIDVLIDPTFLLTLKGTSVSKYVPSGVLVKAKSSFDFTKIDDNVFVDASLSPFIACVTNFSTRAVLAKLHQSNNSFTELLADPELSECDFSNAQAEGAPKTKKVDEKKKKKKVYSKPSFKEEESDSENSSGEESSDGEDSSESDESSGSEDDRDSDDDDDGESGPPGGGFKSSSGVSYIDTIPKIPKDFVIPSCSTVSHWKAIIDGFYPPEYDTYDEMDTRKTEAAQGYDALKKYFDHQSQIWNVDTNWENMEWNELNSIFMNPDSCPYAWRILDNTQSARQQNSFACWVHTTFQKSRNYPLAVCAEKPSSDPSNSFVVITDESDLKIGTALYSRMPDDKFKTIVHNLVVRSDKRVSDKDRKTLQKKFKRMISSVDSSILNSDLQNDLIEGLPKSERKFNELWERNKIDNRQFKKTKGRFVQFLLKQFNDYETDEVARILAQLWCYGVDGDKGRITKDRVSAWANGSIPLPNRGASVKRARGYDHIAERAPRKTQTGHKITGFCIDPIAWENVLTGDSSENRAFLYGKVLRNVRPDMQDLAIQQPFTRASEGSFKPIEDFAKRAEEIAREAPGRGYNRAIVNSLTCGSKLTRPSEHREYSKSKKRRYNSDSDCDDDDYDDFDTGDGFRVDSRGFRMAKSRSRTGAKIRGSSYDSEDESDEQYDEAASIVDCAILSNAVTIPSYLKNLEIASRAANVWELNALMMACSFVLCKDVLLNLEANHMPLPLTFFPIFYEEVLEMFATLCLNEGIGQSLFYNCITTMGIRSDNETVHVDVSGWFAHVIINEWGMWIHHCSRIKQMLGGWKKSFVRNYEDMSISKHSIRSNGFETVFGQNSNTKGSIVIAHMGGSQTRADIGKYTNGVISLGGNSMPVGPICGYISGNINPMNVHLPQPWPSCYFINKLTNWYTKNKAAQWNITTYQDRRDSDVRDQLSFRGFQKQWNPKAGEYKKLCDAEGPLAGMRPGMKNVFTGQKGLLADLNDSSSN